MDTESIVKSQRDFFYTAKTIDIKWRIKALNDLKKGLKKYENELLNAVKTDLGKSRAEAYMCELGLTLSELSYVRKHIKCWSRNECKATPLTNFHAKSFIVHEPYGVVLIMSPWNYPVLLTLEPLVGAIAAGNCVVLKPSAYSPATSTVIAKMISEIFPPEYVTVVTGGRAENQSLLDQKFDYIFFTGGVTVGKLVMSKAAQNLTPITLELGGKSPVIVDHTASLRTAARRIVFGKYLNCGQTCIAPDYVLCEASIHNQFIELLKEESAKMYGANPLQNSDYGKMINQKHFDRVNGLIDASKVVMGGQSNPTTLQIAPTILDNVTADDAVMGEEIFGPVLPVIIVKDVDEAYTFIKQRPHPLALYLFTNDKRTEKRFMAELPFGGGCVNDTIIHIATENLPFGGVGNSGMGSYHGKKSFETFSHAKSVVKKYNWLDLTLRYQPYKKWKDTLIHIFLH